MSDHWKTWCFGLYGNDPVMPVIFVDCCVISIPDYKQHQNQLVLNERALTRNIQIWFQCRGTLAKNSESWNENQSHTSAHARNASKLVKSSMSKNRSLIGNRTKQTNKKLVGKTEMWSHAYVALLKSFVQKLVSCVQIHCSGAAWLRHFEIDPVWGQTHFFIAVWFH